MSGGTVLLASSDSWYLCVMVCRRVPRLKRVCRVQALELQLSEAELALVSVRSCIYGGGTRSRAQGPSIGRLLQRTGWRLRRYTRMSVTQLAVQCLRPVHFFLLRPIA